MTAVEWLEKKFSDNEFDDCFYLAKNQKWFEQAKEMEKQQIIDAFDEGQEYEYQYHINNAPKFYSETYFAETYGSKKRYDEMSDKEIEDWGIENN